MHERARKSLAGTRAVWILRILFLVMLIMAWVFATRQGRPSLVEVHIIDSESGEKVPARVRVTNANGDPVSSPDDAMSLPGSVLGIPKEAVAVMYGRQDRAEGFSSQPDGSFYTEGSFSLDLPPGQYGIEITKGYEYRKIEHNIRVAAGQSRSLDLRLERWINMPARGWYSADDHIHLTRSPREDPLILRWIAAEDIHIGNLLQMGDFWSTFFSQYSFGEAGRYREGDYILNSGQEDPRTPEIGHTISLGASDFVRFRGDYYRYDRVFDRVHELGGITGYAHQGMSFYGYRGMSLDIPQKKLDFLELLQFCVEGGPLHLKHYYHFLDLGHKLTATAGSDFPWCGRGPSFGLEEGCSQIGDARFYTYVPGPLSFETWFSALKLGHTFVSSGPMLEFQVNGAIPGSELNVASGTPLKIEAKAYGAKGMIPLANLEIVVHGEVLASVTSDEADNQEELSLEKQITANHGVWLAARCKGEAAQFAHTTPVYVRVDGGGFQNSKTVDHYLRLTDEYLTEIENELAISGSGLDSQIGRHQERITERIQQVRALLEEQKAELSSP